MLTISIDRAAFWEFKARCAEADLAIARARAVLDELMTAKDAIVERFAVSLVLDPLQPLILDDEAFTVTQA